MKQLLIKPIIHIYLIIIDICTILLDKYVFIELLNRYNLEGNIIYKLYITMCAILLILLNIHIVKMTMKYIINFVKEIFKSV